MVLEAKNVRKDYGGTTVLDGASLTIDAGEKVGLVGRNGAGKSTLLRILLGEDTDYSGAVHRSTEFRVAAVRQYFPDFAGTAVEYLVQEPLDLRKRLRESEEALAGDLAPGGMDRALADYSTLREAYERSGGDEAEERARRFLDTIGLSGAADTPTSRLSGGERNVLALGRAVMARSDLLVLDEPGNHLDAWGLAWLEAFLAGVPQAVLVVSHNRYLLDRVVSRVVELEGGIASSYAGGWSSYRMEKLRKSSAQGMDWQADRKRLQRLEELVDRFRRIAGARPDPAWGRRLRAKVTALERARSRAVEKPEGEGPRISAQFISAASKADIAVSVSGYTRSVREGRSERLLFNDAEMLIRVGERVGIVGPNGCGKSTFLTDLVTRGNWDDRVLRIGPSLVLGWCPQHQEIFDAGATVRDALLSLGPNTEDAVYSVLRRFLFDRRSLDSLIGELSGGERNRLCLARAELIGADFLVLDEPTNHLDIPSREAIEEALAEFRGTLLVVSHDRWFLDRLVDRIVLIEDAAFTSWEGNFSEFWYRSGSAALSASSRFTDRRGGMERRGAARAKAERGSETGGRETGASLAARIERLEGERDLLERKASEAAARGDYRSGRRIGGELAKLSRIIDGLYEEWAG